MTHLEVLCNLTNQALERELADKELRGLLVATDLAKGDGTRSETMRLLHTTSGGCRSSLTCCGLGGELLTWGLAYRMPSITLINKVGIM